MRKKTIKLGTILGLLVVMLVTQVASAAVFKDIDKHWAKETIEWAYKKEIAKGYEDGTFKPNHSVTEAEFLALLIRSYEPKEFNYIKNIHWADSYYAFAEVMNYPNRGQRSITNRNLKITREHVAEVIAGTQGVNYQGKDAIHYLLGSGLAKGKSDSISIEGYDGQGTLTRAEAVQFIRNVLEKGLKDEKGNPIIVPRPTKPSPKEELPKLPEPKPQPKPTTPSTPIGSVSAKQLYDKTKEQAKKLGYTTTDFYNTTGRFSEGEGIMAGVYYTHNPGNENGNSMMFVIRDWKNTNDVELFKLVIENYGVDSSNVIQTINKLEVNSGIKGEGQGKVFNYTKRERDGKDSVVFTVRDW